MLSDNRLNNEKLLNTLSKSPIVVFSHCPERSIRRIHDI
uniref:Uncharacterized protein n=1 Tax=uncultured Desulfobacterium sp. TaxID=201089 RepID=E1YBA2_9BACT|nr:unknown protein [uncultured Desulfobacterium sp.]